MGRLKILKTTPLATIQDAGRLGHRRFGIPQSGAMDVNTMQLANNMIGNPITFPVVEYALMGMKLLALDQTTVAVAGASLKVNNEKQRANAVTVNEGDVIDISAPKYVYAYLAIGGRIVAKEDFGSVSTFLMAKLGGLNGGALTVGDELRTDGSNSQALNDKLMLHYDESPAIIRVMKGPEWALLKELPEEKIFEVDPSSNRMGKRLVGEKLSVDSQQIASSAVIPGIIQLPPDGYPIVLMKDCQTVGGYPRIGKVLDDDLGKMAQVKSAGKVKFTLV